MTDLLYVLWRWCKERGLEIFAAITVALLMCLWGGFAYVVLHFVIKFW